VSCDVPGCREIVQHGENGLLVPARRAEPLAAALAQLVTDVPLRIRMGTASRHLAETSFGEREIARQTLELYERLLA
jgi:glycosyltransferase involved in cell wall biosynthesis